MTNITLRLAHIYISTSAYYDNLIRDEFSNRNIDFGRRILKWRVGTFGELGGMYFSFHGAGCAILSGNPDKFEDEKTIVDWDYNDNGLSSFRQGFFKNFVSENYPQVFKKMGGNEGIDEIVEAAIGTGLFIENEGSGDHRFLSIA